MAALQKIRSKGILLIVIIGLGLFAFIAEDFSRALGITSNQSKQQIGEIYGEKLSVNEYQSMIDEYTEAIKFTQGDASLNDAQLNQLKDQVWQTYVNNKLIEHEAEKLGLTVTDDEMKNVIQAGTNPMLLQTPFRNEQTGRFDASMLQRFLKEYADMQNKKDQVPQEYLEYYQKLYKFWGFIEKTLRQNLLMQKYQALLGRSIISNPISAKLAFESRAQKSDAIVASFSYNAIPDNSVSVSDADLKKMYESKKELFRQYGESRDIKYIDIPVVASAADKAALDKEMAEFQSELIKGDDIDNVVRMSQSTVNYAGLPVSKKAYPQDIQNMLDSVSSGIVKGPYYNAADNTMNLIKVLSTVELPDSVQYSLISIANGSDKAKAKASADSIYKAIQGGAKFEDLAKKYKMNGEKQWLTTSQYENATIDEDNRKFINALNNTSVGSTQLLELNQAYIILQIYARNNMIKKYDAAIIKRPIEFSKETYSKAYNAFSHFVAVNKNLKDIEANASKAGYRVMERKDLFSYEHYVANVPGTREAMRWVFAASKGDISPLYECGNNDHLMLIAVTGIHKEGYRTLEDPEVKQAIQSLVIRDKKAEQLTAQLKNVTSIAQALKMPNAVCDTLKNMNFDTPAFVASVGTSEPVLCGGICSAKVNAVSKAVKGNGGVYIYQVISRNKTNDKFNDALVENSLNQANMRGVSQFINELYRKANVKDKRYLYF